MKIGLLQCDDVKPPLQPEFNNYPDMFAELLRAHAPDLDMSVWRVIDQEFPDSIDEYDGWLITGSRHSANDNLPWIARLEDFIRQLDQQQRKMVGICFGHQIMAKALGGQVSLASKGWGIGAYDNNIVESHSWMQPELDVLRLNVSHEEQVTGLPDPARVIAKSTFCPYYMVLYNQHSLGIQGHPEFSRNYTAALLLSRKHIIPAQRLQEGLESLQKTAPVSGSEVGQWILNFLQDS